MGEVGSALKRIFPDAHTYDISSGYGRGMEFLENTYGVVHICFPYANNFEEMVEKYQRRFKPSITIIHSSVPIGTSDKLDAVHSPIRGVHPHLEKGIRTFVKYFGGLKAHEAAQIFKDAGIKTRVVREAKTTEAAKLWDTTQYGVMILLEKEIHKFCRDNGLDFEIVYAEFNETYNLGYASLDMLHVVRPALMHKEGPIGGHCILQNAALLDAPSARRLTGVE